MHDSTKKLIGQIVSIVDDYQSKGYNMTVRQVYYQLVSRNILPNSQASYAKTSKVLTMARMDELVEWNCIVDRVRIPVMPNQFESLASFVEAIKDSYRTYRWTDQDHYIEVMVEKEALAGILEPITRKYHVSLLVNKGYSSASAMHDTAQRILRQQVRAKKECHVLYMGDHDPSGIDMVRDIRRRLIMFNAAPSVDRIALNYEQIEKYQPPPNPAKISDPRSGRYCAKYGTDSWELDALNPEILVDILEKNIRKYLDINKYNKMIQIEDKEKNALDTLMKKMPSSHHLT